MSVTGTGQVSQRTSFLVLISIVAIVLSAMAIFRPTIVFANDDVDDHPALNILKENEAGEPLAGAVFVVEGSDEEFTTGDNGKVCITRLNGQFVEDRPYLVTEITPPPGYALPSEPSRWSSLTLTGAATASRRMPCSSTRPRRRRRRRRRRRERAVELPPQRRRRRQRRRRARAVGRRRRRRLPRQPRMRPEELQALARASWAVTRRRRRTCRIPPRVRSSSARARHRLSGSSPSFCWLHSRTPGLQSVACAADLRSSPADENGPRLVGGRSSCRFDRFPESNAGGP